MISRCLTYFYMARIKLQKFRRMISIPRGQRVIDIGGGDGPFPRANVVCEKFIGDNSERVNTFFQDRPLVIGDIEFLPFKDNSFDFAYCSHILEHVEDPTRAINEITRIAQRGFIEVPSKYLELSATSMKAHLWTIYKSESGELVFEPKLTAVPNPHVDEIFRTRLWGKDFGYMAFHWKNYYSLFNIGMYWEKSIPHQVKKNKGSAPDQSFEKGETESLESIRKVLSASQKHPQKHWDPRRWLKKAIQNYYKDGNQKWLYDCLVCPSTKEPLQRRGQEFVGIKSGTTYPIINGVPVLLKDHGVPSRKQSEIKLSQS